MKKIIDLIVGTRPNIVKACSILKSYEENSQIKEIAELRFIHTGQHYSENLSKNIFSSLKIRDPDIMFNVGPGNQAQQTGLIMAKYEELLIQKPCDLSLVIGDVNSTVACSISAKKSNVKVGHIEAGLRSFDNSMPEEINRILTDSITDIFFTTSSYANQNLLNEGVPKEAIKFVGNTMIDTLKSYLLDAKPPEFLDDYNLYNNDFILLTIHRPANVDNKQYFNHLINEITKKFNHDKIIFPIHPRSKKNLSSEIMKIKNLVIIDALPYLEFIYLLKACNFVITDSGGISEEATFLSKKCFTLRNSTERPETIDSGINHLVASIEEIKNLKLNNTVNPNLKIPEKWDGFAGERIIREICGYLS
ncbi:UDP-N-acetylglucosamine 2-epimerase (non-hydrolyzing) [Alphaproteobacteria bacterium]|nr:UDP-N-acetylglucosamine 2-epimerase (non-hydrolyzing) [Alphaproteobacteria bacterium]